MSSRPMSAADNGANVDSAVGTLYLLLVFSILAQCVMMAISETNRPRVMSDIADVLSYLAAWLTMTLYLYVAFRASPRCMLSSLYQIYYFASVLVGTTAVSFGARMNEIQQLGFANGAFWMLVFCFVITIESLRLGFWFGEKQAGKTEQRSPSVFQTTVSFIAVGVVTGVSFAILYLYGSPLTSGVNRILFWAVVAPSFLSPVRILIFLTFFLVCCLAFYKNYRAVNNIGRVLFLTYIFFGIVLLGEKASLFIIYLSAFLFVLGAQVKYIEVTKVGFTVVAVATILGVYVAYTYETSGLGAEFVWARLALQAQIPWSILLEPQDVLAGGLGYLDRALDFQTIREEISGRYLPANVLAAHSLSGTSLTGFMPSWQILFFGMASSVVMIIVVSFLLGFVQFHIIEKIRQGRLILAFVLFSTHFQILSIWYVGNFNVVIILLILLVILIFMYLAPRLRVALPRGVSRHV